MTRTTWRSTGPLDLAGSPICSQMRDALALAHELRQVALDARGTARPPSGSAAPADCPRAVRVISSKRRRTARVVEEQLVEVAHPIEEEDVRVLAFDAQVLLHHGRVLRQGVVVHGGEGYNKWAGHCRVL